MLRQRSGAILETSGRRARRGTTFCSVCGICIHHQRSKPTEHGFHVACIEDVDPLALGPAATGGADQSLVGGG